MYGCWGEGDPEKLYFCLPSNNPALPWKPVLCVTISAQAHKTIHEDVKGHEGFLTEGRERQLDALWGRD